MPAKAYLVDMRTGISVHTEPTFHEGREYRMLGVVDEPSAHGQFVTATYNNETATLLSAVTNGSLLLTDLIVSSRKKVGGIVTVQFTDGVNTVPIVDIAADSPIQLSHNFKGRVLGWRNADVQVIVSDAFNATVYVGYVRLAKGATLSFEAWDAER